MDLLISSPVSYLDLETLPRSQRRVRRIGGEIFLGFALSLCPFVARGEALVPTTPAESYLIEAKEGLFNKADLETLGLKKVAGEVARVYTATAENWTFCHTPNITVFKDRLYLMWSNGKRYEDSDGQVILWATSDDGANWTTPAVLIAPKDISDNPKGALMSAGWFVDGENLYAYATASEGLKFARPEFTSLWQSKLIDGKTWGKPTYVVPGCFLESVKRIGQGCILLGQGEYGMPFFYFTDQENGQGGWQRAEVSFDRPIIAWLEPGSFTRPDGAIVATIRAKNLKTVLYAAESTDNGKTWKGGPTNFPDSVARTAGGRLPNGDCYIISNPVKRNALVISLSRDGRLFDRAFLLKNNAPPPKFSPKGISKRSRQIAAAAAANPGAQIEAKPVASTEGESVDPVETNAKKVAAGQISYPNACVWRDHLCVAYSLNKDDIEVLRVPLAELSGQTLPEN